MSTRINIKIPNALKSAPERLRALPKMMMKEASKVTKERANKVVDEMREEGSPPTYPIRWDSEKQRKAFFASDGFGGGIPHVRTNDYRDGWRVEEISENEITILNRSDAAPYVGGNPFGKVFSGIHIGRWNNFGEALQKHTRGMVQEIQDRVMATVERTLRFR